MADVAAVIGDLHTGVMKADEGINVTTEESDLLKVLFLLQFIVAVWQTVLGERIDLNQRALTGVLVVKQSHGGTDLILAQSIVSCISKPCQCPL